MNPVDLIRELAEALQNLGGNVIEHTPHELALLTQAQTFLAAQPVVVEVPGCRVREPTRRWPQLIELARGTHLGEEWTEAEQASIDSLPTGPCTVHVVVTPGVR